MTISGDYSSPVTVNGFQCRNCTDVDYAKRNVDPAHPRSGPNNVNAKSDPSQPVELRTKLAKAEAEKQGKVPAVYGKPGAQAAQFHSGAVFDIAA